MSELGALDADLRRIYELSSDLICTIGFDGFFKRVNPAFVRTLGHSEETLLSRALIEFIHEDDRQQTGEMFEQVCRGASCVDCRNRVLCADGSYRWLAWRAVPSPESQLVCAVARDDTERRRLEDSLRMAKAVAESQSDAKGQFLANMSHEIRTPLNAVIGYSTLLLDTPLSAQQLDYLQAVRTAADALLGQLHAILDLSKIEVDKLELEQVPTDLRLAMEDTLEILAESARKKRLPLTCLVDDDCPNFITSDPGRLRQVLINLCGNAIKFTDHGEVIVRARLLQDGGLRRVRIEVTDTGPGIAAEAVAKLFRPFSQVDSSMNRRHGGSGLGLFLCRKLVAALGGMIGVESAVGAGSTFWFTLPLLSAKATEDTGQVLPASSRHTRIMVVEGHAPSREQLGQLLRHLSLEPILCDSALAAERLLDASSDQIPRLFLVSSTLPDAEDTELAVSLRHRFGLRSVRIVRLLLPQESFDTKHSVPEEFDDQLVKPIRTRRLIRMLHEQLEPSGPNRGYAVQSRRSRPSGILPRFDRLPPRVLVVDDNPANQRLTVLMLQRMGCRVDVAADGKEAVQAASGFPYDLILMDVQMPVMDGLLATKQIRKLSGSAGTVPIVALTANAFTSDRDASLQAGMNDFLCKPVTFDTLQRVLRRRLPSHFQVEAQRGSAATPAKDSAGSAEAKELSDELVAIKQSLGDMNVLLDAEAAKKIVEILKDDWPKQIKLAKSKLESFDLHAVGRCAHYLAGSAGQIGASTLAKQCKELERVAGTKNQERSMQLLTAVDLRIRDLLAAL